MGNKLGKISKTIFQDKLAELLGTKKRNEQEARVEHLKLAADAPVFTLVIQADTRTGKVVINSIGGKIPLAAAYTMLDTARTHLAEQAGAQKAAQQAAKPAAPPAPGEVSPPE